MSRPTSATAIHIRRVEAADEGQLIAFWRHVWSNTYGPSLGPTALEAMLSALDRMGISGMLPGRDETGFCALYGNWIVGTAIIAERGRTSFLWGMYVEPNCQRHGVGSLLLSVACASLTVTAVLEARALATSPWAIAFYEKAGFRRAGDEAIELVDGLSRPGVLLRRPFSIG